jgi:hypothetical protein
MSSLPARLDLLLYNVQEYGMVFNTVAPGTELSGILRRVPSMQMENGG